MKKFIFLGVTGILLIGLAGCNSNSDDSSQSSLSSTTQTTSQTTKSKTSSEANPTFKVSVDDAIKAYQEAYPDSDITSLDLETSFGKYLYKVEGVDDNKEYEVQIDAETKEMSKEREENLDSEDQNGAKRKEDKLDLTDLLGVEKVSDIAVKHVGKGQATEWSLDKDLGITYWEVKVVDGQQETDVKINGKTGDILDAETDD